VVKTRLDSATCSFVIYLDSKLRLADLYMSPLLYVLSCIVLKRSQMSLDHAILGFLSERPRSGYELKTRCFDNTIQPLWNADQAQIYRTLDRLQRSRLVSSTRRRQSGRPDRRIYEITPAGRDTLAEWLVTPLPLPPVRDAFALQLYFGASLGDEALSDVLTARRGQHQTRLDTLRAQAAALGDDSQASKRAMTLRQTAFDGAIARERTAVDWLDDCVEAVRQGALPGSEAPGIGQRHLFGT